MKFACTSRRKRTALVALGFRTAIAQKLSDQQQNNYLGSGLWNSTPRSSVVDCTMNFHSDDFLKEHHDFVLKLKIKSTDGKQFHWREKFRFDTASVLRIGTLSLTIVNNTFVSRFKSDPPCETSSTFGFHWSSQL